MGGERVVLMSMAGNNEVSLSEGMKGAEGGREWWTASLNDLTAARIEEAPSREEEGTTSALEWSSGRGSHKSCPNNPKNYIERLRQLK